ncbi:SCO family protein [Inquilinus sp. Marseille-Q2685]|uniref:SCO family protein n=1 Tax=Inquilinus sp. Marseille-Q2685 TaxID=2866581 RepID=UPI001CE498E7|nr:SCO family protein [Inquilinus sp. Marseille-Q2685]
MSRRVKWLLRLLVAALAVNVAALVLLTTGRLPMMPSSGTWVRTGTVLIGGPFTLTATDGRTVTDQTYRGKWLLIYFGYTFCPDACPTALNNMSIALQTLGAEADRIQPLFITVDPKRDTRQVVASYLESFDPRFVGLVGTEAQTDAIIKTYRLYVEPQKESGDTYLVAHSTYVYLMNPDGVFVDVIDGGTPGDQMADAVRKLINEHST